MTFLPDNPENFELEKQISDLFENGTLDFYHKWAKFNHGCADNPKSIFVANWNDTPDGLDTAIEKAGYDIEWSDEVASCDGCNNLLETNPSHYGWQPSYYLGDEGFLCFECLDPEEMYNEFEGKVKRAVSSHIVEEFPPVDYGYILIDREFESGFHPGQNDDPADVAKFLRNNQIKRFFFAISAVGQFDLSFQIWVHKDELCYTQSDWYQDDDGNQYYDGDDNTHWDNEKLEKLCDAFKCTFDRDNSKFIPTIPPYSVKTSELE